MRRPLAVATAIAIAATLAAGALATPAKQQGGPGPDQLRGTNGADVLKGLGGHDELDGRGGADVLIGGTGTDRLEGGTGRDSFNMRLGVAKPAPGRDKIYARDGKPDEINCGTGRDIAYVDDVEDGVYDCERVKAG
jgi:hypothetical protein